MFSFFNKKTATIDSVKIPSWDWNLETDKKDMKLWLSPKEPVAISLHYFNQKPDLPTIKNVGVLRNFYRGMVSAAEGALIEVELIELLDVPAVWTLFKFPMNPTGMRYIGSLTIPFQKCSYVVKVHSEEIGITGIRDNTVMAQLHQEGTIDMTNHMAEDWFYDPYDESILEGLRMNISEQRKYDLAYPDHPLSLVRHYLSKAQTEVTYSDKIKSLRAFGK